ncbi:Uncharacterised protein [Enterobacter hormaechei]|nr:Uncharacterised protein [Enterobacter hormaechei]
MEPEDLRGINVVNTRQRIVAVLIAVDVGQRHIPEHFLQQPEPFPDKPGGDRLAGRLPKQHLAARFADASPERVIAEADLRLRPVAVPRLADDLRQAVLAVVAVVPAGLTVILLHGAAVDVIAPANAVQLRQAVVSDLLSRAFKRVTGCIPAPLLLAGQRAVLNQQTSGAVVLPAVPAERVIVPLFADQIIAIVVIPAAGPSARRRALGIAGKDVPAMQSSKTIVFAAGGQQPLGAAGFTVKFVAGKVGDRQLIKGNAEQMSATVVKLLQLPAIGQRDRGAVAQRIILPRQLPVIARFARDASERVILKHQLLLCLGAPGIG